MTFMLSGLRQVGAARSALAWFWGAECSVAAVAVLEGGRAGWGRGRWCACGQGRGEEFRQAVGEEGCWVAERFQGEAGGQGSAYAFGVMPLSSHAVTAGARRCTSRVASRRRGSSRRRSERSDTTGSEGVEGVGCSGVAVGGVEGVIGRFGRGGVAGVWGFREDFGPELPIIAGGLLYDVVRVITRPDVRRSRVRVR
jgi:hypothetical protein